MSCLLPGKGKLCVTFRCVWFPLEVTVPRLCTKSTSFAGAFPGVPAFDSFFLCCAWSETDSLMSLRKRCLRLFHDPVCDNNIQTSLFNTQEILFLFYMKKSSVVKHFKGIAPGFKIRALVNIEGCCKYRVKTFEAFVEKKNDCCEENLRSIYKCKLTATSC